MSQSTSPSWRSQEGKPRSGGEEGGWGTRGPQIKSQVPGYPQILQVVRTRPQKCHLSRAEVLRGPWGHRALSPEHISPWPKLRGDSHESQPRESAAETTGTACAAWWHSGAKIASLCDRGVIDALRTSWLAAGPASCVPVPVPTPQGAPVPTWASLEVGRDE